LAFRLFLDYDIDLVKELKIGEWSTQDGLLSSKKTASCFVCKVNQQPAGFIFWQQESP